eukprot:TRINITY_DN1947_c0_g1_i1.p1 TRINITY_DN1947_c0_g1~~TRINITY_DN1947_c0_g1_i1.p1  ORF type:complete len:1022 (-),score=175.48 TRINITY_DN1947_c0_g1_i1:3875-6727(-)
MTTIVQLVFTLLGEKETFVNRMTIDTSFMRRLLRENDIVHRALEFDIFGVTAQQVERLKKLLTLSLPFDRAIHHGRWADAMMAWVRWVLRFCDEHKREFDEAELLRQELNREEAILNRLDDQVRETQDRKTLDTRGCTGVFTFSVTGFQQARWCGRGMTASGRPVVPIALPLPIAALPAGVSLVGSGCALSSDGQVYVWSQSDAQALDLPAQIAPERVLGVPKAVSVACIDERYFAVSHAGLYVIDCIQEHKPNATRVPLPLAYGDVPVAVMSDGCHMTTHTAWVKTRQHQWFAVSIWDLKAEQAMFSGLQASVTTIACQTLIAGVPVQGVWPTRLSNVGYFLLTTDGSVYVSGCNVSNMLGMGTALTSRILYDSAVKHCAFQDMPVSDIVTIEGEFTLFLLRNGDVFYHSACGSGSLVSRSIPTILPALSGHKAKQIGSEVLNKAAVILLADGSIVTLLQQMPCLRFVPNIRATQIARISKVGVAIGTVTFPDTLSRLLVTTIATQSATALAQRRNVGDLVNTSLTAAFHRAKAVGALTSQLIITMLDHGLNELSFSGMLLCEVVTLISRVDIQSRVVQLDLSDVSWLSKSIDSSEFNLTSLKQLRTLILTGAKFNEHESFEFMDNAVSLNVVDFSHSNFSDAHLAQVLQRVPEYLHTLDLSYCNRLTRASHELVSSCGIKHLNFILTGTTISEAALAFAKHRQDAAAIARSERERLEEQHRTQRMNARAQSSMSRRATTPNKLVREQHVVKLDPDESLVPFAEEPRFRNSPTRSISMNFHVSSGRATSPARPRSRASMSHSSPVPLQRPEDETSSSDLPMIVATRPPTRARSPVRPKTASSPTRRPPQAPPTDAPIFKAFEQYVPRIRRGQPQQAPARPGSPVGSYGDSVQYVASGSPSKPIAPIYNQTASMLPEYVRPVPQVRRNSLFVAPAVVKSLGAGFFIDRRR